MTDKELKSNPYDRFLDAYLEELMATPDSELLEGRPASEVDAEAKKLLASARVEAGKRRLAAARSKLAQENQSHKPVPLVTLEEAKQFLVNAANDPRYTLAARELTEMSEAEILRLYQDLKQLEADNE